MKLIEAGEGALSTSPSLGPDRHERIVESARLAVAHHAEALHALAGRIDDSFAASVDCLLACHGRVVLTGLGKSGIVARKIASTFSATGTPSFFLHATEALHGDLGMVTRDDAVVFVSYSGETAELLALVPHLGRRGVRMIGLLGAPRSTLARGIDLVLDASVSTEACPFDLVPTTSAVAALALGDALALAVMQARGFGPDDFAEHHPGGKLGERLRAMTCDGDARLLPTPGRGPRR